MYRIRVVRSHRKDSWTRSFIGETFYVAEEAPKIEVAGVLNAPYAPEPVKGWDVVMALLTAAQRARLWEITGGVLVADLFAPAECVEFLGPVVLS